MRLLYILREHKLRLLAGLALFSITIFIGLALSSYNADDPSFNRAVDAEAQNVVGNLGAFISDPILQLFGLSSVWLVLVPFLWSMSLITLRRMKMMSLSVFSWVVSIISTSYLLSYITPPEGWPFISMGGFTGYTINRLVANNFIGYEYIPIAVASLLLIINIVLAANVNLKQCVYMGRSIWNSTVILFRVFKLSFLMVFYVVNKAINLFSKKPVVTDEDNLKELLPKHKTADIDRIKKEIKKIKSTKQTKVHAKIGVKTAYVEADDFILPELDYLSLPSEKQKKSITSESQLKQQANLLKKVLEDFGVTGDIVNIHPGPVVTLYELEPSAGTKSSRVIGLADDIARSMSAISARIAVIPGRNAIGIELPNPQRDIVLLRELLETNDYNDSSIKLPIVLGKDIGGRGVVVDLAKMPHLLVAGTTGSGKSVAINTMILSLLYKLSPEQCKFIMIDPKMLELSVYEGIPHLLAPVVTEPGKAVTALKWVVKEMENRYRMMSNLGVRNIAGYNKRIEEAIANNETIERTVQTGFNPETGKPIFEKVPLDIKPLPFIVVIVDEMADLMLVAGKDIETSIQRLAQMARAAGIHIIMATQRPSVDVITGVIKANFPTRISFQVTSRIDSRTILGEHGAEQLLGMGDMLYMAGGSKIVRVHGPFVDDKEVEKVVDHLKMQAVPDYIANITESDEEDDTFAAASGGEDDDLYNQAIKIIMQEGKVSTSYIQRCLRIGYNRAAIIVERMEKEGIVSKPNHAGKREILINQ
jgi:S-DNA-T family DNA segregation ATPase FtsK/SpoIIIE